jgi:cell fate regulator YaaT (PSP1 superfamily)
MMSWSGADKPSADIDKENEPMSDNRKDIHIDDLERLENLERSNSGRQGKQRGPALQEELPEVLYRLKTLHSCETFYGYFEASKGEWPHFRTLSELEAILEGPFSSTSDSAAESDAEPEAAIEVASLAPAEGEPEAAAKEVAAQETAAATAVSVSDATGTSVDAIEAPNAAVDETAAGYASTEEAAVEETAVEETGAAETSPDAIAPAETSDAAAVLTAVSGAVDPGIAAKAAAPAMFIPRRALVVAPTKYGRDVVEVQGRVVDKSLANADEVVAIERPASIDDLRRLKDNAEKEKKAFELCRDKIWSRNLPMKLVSAHYLLDEPKILFYFAAESRVDFRELVKDLVSLFKTRIELRQIGVRDEARVTGGCGVCGRVLCCHGISDRLNPVSIKMAKDQNLSLNSLKISGPCGRLLCCLSYEFQFYRDARRELPQEGAKFIYDGVLFKVVEVNALASMVKMAGEDGRVLDMKAERFKYSEGRWKVIEDIVETGST